MENTRVFPSVPEATCGQLTPLTGSGGGKEQRQSPPLVQDGNVSLDL